MSKNKTSWTVASDGETILDASRFTVCQVDGSPLFYDYDTSRHPSDDPSWSRDLSEDEVESRARLIAAAPEMVERYLTKLARWADIAERNPSFHDDHAVYSTASAGAEVTWTLGELKEARALLASIRGESA